MNYKRILNSNEFSFSSDSWIFCVIVQYRFISTIYYSIVFIDLLNNYRTKPHILKRMTLSPPKVWMNDILTPKGQMIDWGTNCLCFQYCDRIIRFFCIAPCKVIALTTFQQQKLMLYIALLNFLYQFMASFLNVLLPIYVFLLF